jgi:hypothetical protein
MGVLFRGQLLVDELFVFSGDWHVEDQVMALQGN